MHVIILMTTKFKDFDFYNVLVGENSHENVLIYNISYKTWFILNSLRIRFNQINELIRIYDWTRYLVLFGSEKYDAIYQKLGIL